MEDKGVELVDGAVLVEGTVLVQVELTAEQYQWLKTLGDDLRSDFSSAVQCCVDSDIEADKNDKYNPSRYKIVKGFESWMQRCDWKEAKETLDKLQLLYQQAEIRNKLIDMRRQEERKKSGMITAAPLVTAQEDHASQEETTEE